MKPVVLALVGPTGSGKTRTAIRLCQALNAEIVSMDSMQVYRGMDIGTAKPTREELAAALPPFTQTETASTQPMLIEVFTDAAHDMELLKAYYHQLKNSFAQ